MRSARRRTRHAGSCCYVTGRPSATSRDGTPPRRRTASSSSSTIPRSGSPRTTATSSRSSTRTSPRRRARPARTSRTSGCGPRVPTFSLFTSLPALVTSIVKLGPTSPFKTGIAACADPRTSPAKTDAAATDSVKCLKLELLDSLSGVSRLYETAPRADSGNGQLALHARGGVAGHGALVGELAGAKRDGERSFLAGCDQLALLAGDGEVVLDGALVDEDERHLAMRDGLLREYELELGHLHVDGRRRRRGRSGRNRRGRDESRQRDPERERDAFHEDEAPSPVVRFRQPS